MIAFANCSRLEPGFEIESTRSYLCQLGDLEEHLGLPLSHSSCRSLIRSHLLPWNPQPFARKATDSDYRLAFAAWAIVAEYW